MFAGNHANGNFVQNGSFDEKNLLAGKTASRNFKIIDVIEEFDTAGKTAVLVSGFHENLCSSDFRRTDILFKIAIFVTFIPLHQIVDSNPPILSLISYKFE